MTDSERYNAAFELDEKRELEFMQGGMDDFILGDGWELGPGDVLNVIAVNGYIKVSE